MYETKQQEARRKRNEKIADIIVNTIVVLAIAFLTGSAVYGIGLLLGAW